MADYYADSSALVKRYIRETGSSWVSGLFDSALSNDVFIGELTQVEIVAAITRRARGGTINAPDAAASCALFRNDLSTDYQVVELTEALVSRAMSLAETHGLRGYDAVQLASALAVNTLSVASNLSPVTFVSADGELNAVAASLGLLVDNPNNHP